MCLIDPDMLLLRPITPRLSEGLVASDRTGKAGKNQEEMQDAQGVARVLTVASTTRVADLPPRVEVSRHTQVNI